MLSSDDFAWMAHHIVDYCNTECVPCVFAHEGGYSPFSVPFCCASVVETMSGKSFHIHDFFAEEVHNYHYQELQVHQKQVIDRVKVEVYEKLLLPALSKYQR
jgi:acetoin utilization deacetylase AcuC-like enzyme